MTTLAHELDRYLVVRHSLGFDLSTSARILKGFVAFADSQSVDYITTGLFLQWQRAFGKAGTSTWAARLGMVRLFAQWLSGIDPRTEVPPRGLIPGRYRRVRPYIYSEDEIRRVVDGATRLRSPNGLRALTYSTLFSLIAVTGLRVSEAIALDDRDVDLVSGVLTVRRGKGGRTRIVPISESATARLSAYAAERNGLLSVPPASFFVSDNGRRPTDCGVRYNFAVVCQQVGLRPVQRFCRHGRGPRIHDLRHTFAARTLLTWYRNGIDPEQELAKLSTYLGHTDPVYTYWYLEAVPELLELASTRAQASLQQEGRR